MKKLWLLLTIFSLPLFAAAPYGILIDINFSPYSGAEILMLPQKGVMVAEDRSSFKNSNVPFVNGLLRAAELVLFWDPLGQVEMVTQHEVFGHGYRIRSLGSQFASVAGYGIDAPEPYGPGGGVTSYYQYPDLTTSQKLAITTGGVEATAILAGELKKKWLLDNQIDARQAALYLYSEHDLTHYVLSLNGDPISPFASNDMQAYIFWLNATYPGTVLTENQLKLEVLINLLDPITFYSLYSWFKYIGTGETTGIPMLPAGSARWLPNFRLGLTPFGPETFLETYLTYHGKLTYFYIKGGRFGSNHYYGIGIENKTIWRMSSLCLGLRFDGWRQPPYSSFLVNQAEEGFISPTRTGGNRYGAALQATAYYPFYNNKLMLYAVVGAKTIGFLPGESLTAGPILRLGLFTSL